MFKDELATDAKQVITPFQIAFLVLATIEEQQKTFAMKFPPPASVKTTFMVWLVTSAKRELSILIPGIQMDVQSVFALEKQLGALALTFIEVR